MVAADHALNGARGAGSTRAGKTIHASNMLLLK
mgnify:CR=1 FL=1